MKTITPAIAAIATLAIACNTGQAQVSKAPAAPPAPAAPAVPAVPGAPPAPPPPVEPQFEPTANDEDIALEAGLDRADMQLLATEKALAKGQFALAEAFAKATGGRSSTRERTLVIPKDTSDAKSLDETEEDLNIMARILEKAASTREQRNAHAMGIIINAPFSGRVLPQNLYLEGYGALFLLNVNYPLLPPPSPKPEEAESKEPTNSEWEEARRELHRPPGWTFKYDWSDKAPGGGAPPGIPGEKYEAGKVETLKKELISALKNAAHIRKLKSDETVVIVVTGRGVSAPPKPFPVESKPVPKTATRSRVVPARPLLLGSESPGTKLILRARKSDIENFQKEKLSLEEFRKKVSVMLLES